MLNRKTCLLCRSTLYQCGNAKYCASCKYENDDSSDPILNSKFAVNDENIFIVLGDTEFILTIKTRQVSCRKFNIMSFSREIKTDVFKFQKGWTLNEVYKKIKKYAAFQ